MEQRRGSTVDVISRLLGVLAICLGLGGSYFFYQENVQLKSQIAELTGSESAVDFESAKKFNEEWDQQLRAALDDFKSQGNEAIQMVSDANQEHSRKFQVELAELEADRLDLQQLDTRVQSIQGIVMAPRLRTAEARLSPTGSGDAAYRLIANDGASDAKILTARFRTMRGGQFPVESPISMQPAADRLLIDFSPAHNTSKDLTRHRDYERTYLDQALIVPEGERVAIEVVIQNDRHVGWGWTGELELEYDNGRTLVVPDVRAVFVPEDDNAT